ncbi:MAG: hypothetical protein JSW06_06255 [Thermoplasmatales archaeon]|nr:MAG: hypothetical protein JSW06_06255 [Thermoplasmatales archaeon]
MKKILVGIIVCMLLIITVLPVLGNNDSKRLNIALNQNEKYHTTKAIILGIIKDMQSGNITSYTSVRVLYFIIHDYNGTKIPLFGMSINSKTVFDKKLNQFRGILLKHFICGIVKFPKVTASPGSLEFGQPAELEILVTVNDEGVSDVLVNISIPGISEEMSTYTDTNGKSLFAFTPPSTGEIKIEIENKRIPLTVEIMA